MQPKNLLKSKKNVAISIGVVVLLLIAGGIYFLLAKPPAEEKFVYQPTEELPQNYGIITEPPQDNETLLFTAMLSTLAVDSDGIYHPLFITDENGMLDDHQMDTITKAGLEDYNYLVFSSDPESKNPVDNQINVHGVYEISSDSIAMFKGFDGIMTVSTYEEALWAASVAAERNLGMVEGPATYESQEEAWSDLKSENVPFDYVMVANPMDLSVETLHKLPGYSDEDDKFHIPALSAITAEVAAYRKAYVLTQSSPSTEDIGDMDYDLNSRAIGYYLDLKEMTSKYGIPSYVTLVGSASAVPQFQFPDQTNADEENVEGDKLVSSDVAYGFLGDDPYYMDSAVGRLVNLNLQGLSNQMVRTFMYDRFEDNVRIDYTAGTQDVTWNKHGTSFSGYEITYERGQVTPARFWCRDADDEGMTYDYIGPSNIGRDILIGDGVDPKGQDDMNNAMEASGFVAYRGHGSEYGSLYMVPYAVGDERAVLRAEEVGNLLLPPQVGFWVACMNAKIHGAGWWKPAEPIEIERSFALNYLYGGAVIAGGATEVSFSNIAQDATSAPEEFLPGVINPSWSDDNYEWDLNDAWFAFFWDGLLNNEEDYGTAGEALRWAENRYIHNPIRDKKVSPFIQDLEDPDWQGGLLGAHWKEVAMFAIYGDPAFSPEPNAPGMNSYRPWTNGPEDTGEP